MDLSLEQVRHAVVFLIALVLSITVHEYGHALVADKLGDRTPRSQGRVTLNPLVHADPFGTVLFPLISILMGSPIMFGWGRPVMVSPIQFTRKLRMRTAHLLVAAAGPAMNVLLAVIVTTILAICLKTGALSLDQPLASGIVQVIMLNWVLCFFNLIPCPPLDGGTVLAGLLPDRYLYVMNFLQQWGMWILIALLLTGVARIFTAPAIWLTNASIGAVLAFVY